MVMVTVTYRSMQKKGTVLYLSNTFYVGFHWWYLVAFDWHWLHLLIETGIGRRGVFHCILENYIRRNRISDVNCAAYSLLVVSVIVRANAGWCDGT
jgi:hypothetical protein